MNDDHTIYFRNIITCAPAKAQKITIPVTCNKELEFTISQCFISFEFYFLISTIVYQEYDSEYSHCDW